MKRLTLVLAIALALPACKSATEPEFIDCSKAENYPPCIRIFELPDSLKS